MRLSTSALLTALLLPLFLHAQITFQRTYGGVSGDYGYSVQQTSDCGYVIAGFTSSFGGDDDVYLVRTNASGDTLWTRTFGGPLPDEGLSVQQTSDSGYVIAGYTRSFGAGGDDVYLVKTDANDDTLWTRALGGNDLDQGYSVQQTTDGGYIVAGTTESFGAGYYDVYLVKTDANGDTLWTRTYGGADLDIGYSVQQTRDGGYIVTGYTLSFGTGGDDVYLVKTDANGDTQWTRTHGGTGFEHGLEVQQTSDSGYIIVGFTDSYGAGHEDIYLIRADAAGDMLWKQAFGGAYYDEGWSVRQTAGGGYIIAGLTYSFGAGGADVYLLKTDADGETLWTRTFGGADEDRGRSVRLTTDGGYVVTGYTFSFGAGAWDVYLIKTDSLGNVAVAEPGGSRGEVGGEVGTLPNFLRIRGGSRDTSQFPAYQGRPARCAGNPKLEILNPKPEDRRR